MKHLKDKKKSTISAQHLLYLKKIRRNKIIVHTVRAFILIAVIGLWELCARVGVFDPFITSSPSRVVSTIADLAASEEILPAHVFEAVSYRLGDSLE